MGEIMGIWSSCIVCGEMNIITASMMGYLVISKDLNVHIPFVPEILLLRMYDGDEFEQAPGLGDGHGSLASCRPPGPKESDTTEQLEEPSHLKRP